MTVYDFKARTIDGEEVSLSHYRGKVLLIVNVASRCGFTPQYRGLEEEFEIPEESEEKKPVADASEAKATTKKTERSALGISVLQFGQQYGDGHA